MTEQDKDREYLGRLQDYYADSQRIPSLQRVCGLMGFSSKTAAKKLLHRLEAEKFVTRTPDGSIFVVGHSHPNTAFIVRIAPDGSVTKVAGSGELPDDRPDERPTGE